MKIIVTGGAGFIGSQIVDCYISLGHTVVIIDNLYTGNKKWLNPNAIFYEVDIRDKDKIKEVILNLVSNALKYTASGGKISLTGAIVGANAEIVAEDTGLGIAPEVLPQIFERFYRIDNDGSRGTGIGLNICKQVIEVHGGSISAESEPGKGSRFIIHLPLQKPNESSLKLY